MVWSLILLEQFLKMRTVHADSGNQKNKIAPVLVQVPLTITAINGSIGQYAIPIYMLFLSSLDMC